MDYKPNFLMRGWSEMRERFSQLGRKINANKIAGTTDSAANAEYKQLNDFMRDASTTLRHKQWWQVYKPAYDKALDAALYDGMTKKQADKQARRDAAVAVVATFPDEVTTTRAVRNALNYMHDEPPLPPS